METGITERKPQENNKNILFDDLDKMYNENLLPLLLFLFSNSNDMTFNELILNLIFKCFTQKSKLVKSLKKVQVLFDKEEQRLFDHINKRRLELNFVCEQSEVWMNIKSNSDERSTKILVYSVIDILKELIDFLYGSINLRNQNHYMNENRYDVNDIDYLRQLMMKNLKVHEIILKLLRDGTYVLEAINEKNEGNKLIVEVFELCYDFLMKFCKNDNKENKKILHKEINFFYQHLNYFDLGQTKLINEIFKNNFKISILVTEDLLTAYISKISQQCDQGGHNPIYLDLFDNIMFIKNEPIVENCNKIRFLILDKKKNDYLFMKENTYFSNVTKEDEKNENFSSFFDQIRRNFSNFGHYVFCLDYKDWGRNDVPYVYHAQALKIVYNLIVTSDEKNILKFLCQKTLNLNYLFYLLNQEDIFQKENSKAFLTTILNIEVLKIVNEVWLKSEKQPSSIFNNNYVVDFLKKHIKIMKRLDKTDCDHIKSIRRATFFKVLQNKREINRSLDSKSLISEQFEEKGELIEENNEEEFLEKIIAKYCHGYRFDYVDCLLNQILPMVLSLNKLLVINEKILENISQRPDLKALSDFSEIFALFYKKCIENTAFLRNKKYYKLLEEYERTFNVSLNLPNFKEESNSIYENLEKELDDEIEFPMRHLLINRKNEKNQNHNNFWKVFILNLITSQHIKEIVDQEYESLINSIKDIHNLKFTEIFAKEKKSLINLDGFIKQIVNFVKHCSEKADKKNTMILNNVINLLGDLLRSSKGGEKNKIQNFMLKSNLAKIIIYYLCHYDYKSKTYINMIGLANQLLADGNTDGQNSFFDCFINTNFTEILFYSLHSLISDEILKANKHKSLHETIDQCLHEVNFSYKKKNDPKIIVIMKFLQSLTENHHVNLQVLSFFCIYKKVFWFFLELFKISI